MKKMLLTVALVLFSLGSDAQVSFQKFKFIKDSPFGCCPGRRATDTKFTITGDKMVKYVRVYYVGVNQVGDAVSSQIVGAVNANTEHTKHRYLDLTGPFEPRQSYSRWATASFIYPSKVTAFPIRIDLIYRDGSEEEIFIDDSNLKTFFPSLKWMDVNLVDGI